MSKIEDGPAFGAWQPIETAPKDGTPFVICCEGDPTSIEAGRYDPYYSYSFEEAADIQDAGGGALYRRRRQAVSDWSGFNNFRRATHWMPLPPPPADAMIAARKGGSHGE